MKRYLLATGILALSAGVAAAQGVTISGDARMGLAYDTQPQLEGSNVSKWQMTSRARVEFTLSGQTDTGLTFGASFRVDNASEAAGNTNMTDGEVFISGAFGTLTMGNPDSAALSRVGDLAFTSLTDLGDPYEMVYISRQQGDSFYEYINLADPDDTIDIGYPTAVRYDYAIEGFTVSVSLDQFRKFESDELALRDLIYIDSGFWFDSGTVRARGWSVGASYEYGPVTVSAGYERLDLIPSDDYRRFRATHAIVGAEATFEGVTVKGIYGRAGGNLGNILKDTRQFRRDQYGASVEANFDEVTVSLFGNRDFFGSTKAGIGASYDLGGGAQIVGGIARERTYDVQAVLEETDTSRTRRTRADFGVKMSF